MRCPHASSSSSSAPAQSAPWSSSDSSTSELRSSWYAVPSSDHDPSSRCCLNRAEVLVPGLQLPPPTWNHLHVGQCTAHYSSSLLRAHCSQCPLQCSLLMIREHVLILRTTVAAKACLTLLITHEFSTGLPELAKSISDMHVRRVKLVSVLPLV